MKQQIIIIIIIIIKKFKVHCYPSSIISSLFIKILKNLYIYIRIKNLKNWISTRCGSPSMARNSEAMVALTSSSPSALNLKNQTHKGPQHSYTYKYHPKIKGPKLHKMPPPSLNFMFFLSLLLLLHLRPAIPAITIPPGYSVPAVFVFGDSIVDTGNNNNVITQAKCNYPPYGRDFSDGRPTGRFSNGRVPSDLVGINNLLLNIRIT